MGAGPERQARRNASGRSGVREGQLSGSRRSTDRPLRVTDSERATGWNRLFGPLTGVVQRVPRLVAPGNLRHLADGVIPRARTRRKGWLAKVRHQVRRCREVVGVAAAFERPLLLRVVDQPQIVQARTSPCVRSRPSEAWNGDRRQQRDDGDDDHGLHQSESRDARAFRAVGARRMMHALV